MLPNIPDPLAYDLSTTHGFLPSKLPLRRLSDVYYSAWEDVVSNLQPLLLSGRLREVVRVLPVLATTSLDGLPEWRRAYVVLGFLVHAYIWGGSVPEEVCWFWYTLLSFLRWLFWDSDALLWRRNLSFASGRS